MKKKKNLIMRMLTCILRTLTHFVWSGRKSTCEEVIRTRYIKTKKTPITIELKRKKGKPVKVKAKVSTPKKKKKLKSKKKGK